MRSVLWLLPPIHKTMGCKNVLSYQVTRSEQAYRINTEKLEARKAMSDLLQAALSYINQGFKVFPVKPDKKPLTPHGLKDAAHTEAGVREFWTRWPEAGIGMVTDGLIILDFDVKNDGLNSKQSIERKYGPLPRTRTHWIPAILRG